MCYSPTLLRRMDIIYIILGGGGGGGGAFSNLVTKLSKLLVIFYRDLL